MQHSHENRKAGFTLVEVLVISPILVILVAVLIGFMVNLTGSALQARQRTALVYSIQEALSQIESDVRSATEVTANTGLIDAPQGSNSGFAGTSAFASSSTVLVLQHHATTKNPLDPSRSLLYYADSPNACGSTGMEYNDKVTLFTVYYKDGTNLKRRTIVDFDGRRVCNVGTNENMAGIWQKNTCNTIGTAPSGCFSRDLVVLENVNTVNFAYYLSPSSSVSTSNFADVRTVGATLSGRVTAAGVQLDQSLSIRATRIN